MQRKFQTHCRYVNNLVSFTQKKQCLTSEKFSKNNLRSRELFHKPHFFQNTKDLKEKEKAVGKLIENGLK